MTRKSFLLASLAFAAMPAPAFAAGDYYVRNATGRTMSCGLRREHGEMMDRFVLRAGTDWRQTGAGEGSRTLICFTNAIPPRYRLRSGVRYALVDQGGRLALRVDEP